MGSTKVLTITTLVKRKYKLIDTFIFVRDCLSEKWSQNKEFIFL